MSRRFALHLHPDKGHWQSPGSFSLNTHTHTHKGTLQNTAVLYLSISLFFFLSQTHTPTLECIQHLFHSFNLIYFPWKYGVILRLKTGVYATLS